MLSHSLVPLFGFAVWPCSSVRPCFSESLCLQSSHNLQLTWSTLECDDIGEPQGAFYKLLINLIVFTCLHYLWLSQVFPFCFLWQVDFVCESLWMHFTVVLLLLCSSRVTRTFFRGCHCEGLVDFLDAQAKNLPHSAKTQLPGVSHS